MWTLTITGSNIVAYTNRFSDIATLCPKMCTLESKKIERYIWGLSSLIQGNVITAKPLTFDSEKHLPQTLAGDGVRQGLMTPTPEPAREDNYKQNSKNNKKRQATQ